MKKTMKNTMLEVTPILLSGMFIYVGWQGVDLYLNGSQEMYNVAKNERPSPSNQASEHGIERYMEELKASIQNEK